MSDKHTPSPVEFGMPARFSEWRAGQDDFFWDIIDSNSTAAKRFCIRNAPVGMGKSLAYMTAAKVLGGRTVIVTATKPLQDQLSADFKSIGAFDMRGLSNYPCVALEDGGFLEKMWMKRWGKPTCDVGPCTSGIRCDLKNSGCRYFDDYRIACAPGTEILQTNYAYWIAIHKYGQGLGKFDRVFFDEVHSADAQLASALTVEFTERDYKMLESKPPKLGSPLSSWRMWGRVQHQRVCGKLEFFANGARIGQQTDGRAVLVNDTDIPDASELRLWKRLEGKCETLSDSSDDWIVERDERTGNIRFAPAWIKKYAESYLFRGIKKIGMFSGTVRPKIAELLGIGDGTWNFAEYPSTFPVERRPIYWIPTVRLNNETGHDDYRTWVARIDQLISRRQDRKGIIHTVSYDRQKYLMMHSRFRGMMLANTTGNTRDIVKMFRESETPVILVSPSVGTGFDFPMDSARYQIIGKVPYKDHRGAIMQRQLATDPDYGSYLTAQDLIQLYGRTNRDPEDFSETFIIDDNIEWFIRRYRDFFPDYFLEAFQRIDFVPDPPALGDIQ